jgi:uncharacterized membrane protein YuzA (DUF378 family)
MENTTRVNVMLLNMLRAAAAIASIGALNWGLIGLFNWNLVDAIFGGGTAEETSTASRVLYALVGISGILVLSLLPARGLRKEPVSPFPTTQQRT